MSMTALTLTSCVSTTGSAIEAHLTETVEGSIRDRSNCTQQQHTGESHEMSDGTTADREKCRVRSVSMSSNEDPSIGTYTTASGTWRVRREGTGFFWTLDENPNWSSAMACNTTDVPITTTVDRWTLFVPQRTCKFAQDAPPVALNAQSIRDAVADERWVPYRALLAEPWPAAFGTSHELERASNVNYDPAAMNGNTNSDNIVGIISGQGGEYPTSRGATDELDAEIIALALDGEDITPHANALYNIAFASAGFPYRTPFRDTMLLDPQRPSEGIQYEYPAGGYDVLDEVERVEPPREWLTDPYHLANSGWALWLATEDPRIGMIVQSHAAFSLATWPQYLREALLDNDGFMSVYRCNDSQTRAQYNCLTAMWRARDVARRVRSDDTMVWSEARVNKMYADTTEQSRLIHRSILDAGPENYSYASLRAASVPARRSYCAEYRHTEGANTFALSRSNFMDQQYGGVPLYLRARAGEPVGLELMDAVTRHIIARTLYIGGAAGVSTIHDTRGSSVPIGPCRLADGHATRQEAAPPPYTTTRGWADWVLAQNFTSHNGDLPDRTTLAGASAHTAIQTDFILRAAKDLVTRNLLDPIEDLDAAIAAFAAARDATAGPLRFQIWFKHTQDILD